MNAANPDIASPDNSFSYPGKVSLDVAARCNVELYRTFYKQIHAAVLVSALNAILVAGVVWDSVPRVPLIAWGTFIIGLSSVRLLLFALRRRRAALSDEEAIILRRTAASFFAIGGLAWGVGSVFVILESESIVHHVFMAFVIAGMGAGAMAGLTFCLPAFYGFCLPALFMSAAAYFVVGEQPHIVMGAMVLLFATMLIYFARNVYHSMFNSVRLRFENAELFQRAAEARETAGA